MHLSQPLRKLANAQTERSVAATSTVLVTESKLGSGYLFCYVTAETLDIDNSPIIALLPYVMYHNASEIYISIEFILKSIPNNNMNLLNCTMIFT